MNNMINNTTIKHVIIETDKSYSIWNKDESRWIM